MIWAGESVQQELAALYALLAAPAGSYAIGWAHTVLQRGGMDPCRLSRADMQTEIRARETMLGHLETVNNAPLVDDPPRGFI